MKLVPFALLVALAFIFAPTAVAMTHTVDCGGGAMHTAIQPAVNAAAPGDVVVVRPCNAGYPNGFIVSNKSGIQIVGAEAPALVGAYPVGAGINPITTPLIFDNNATCVDIDNSRDISIVGLTLESCINNGIRIERSRRITIQGNSLYFAGADGVVVLDSRHVSITGNSFFGAQGPAGVHVVAGTNRFITLQNNRVMFNSGIGIHAEANRVDILNNEVANNQGTGILVQNGRSKVSRNTVTGNGSGALPQIDYTSLLANTCLVGNSTNAGILPPTGGCQEDNT